MQLFCWTVLNDEIGLIHSCRARAQLVREEFCWGLTHDVLEFLDQVGLIGQSTGQGDLRPRQAVASCREHFLKPRQAGESLRTDAKKCIEDTRDMANAAAQPSGEGMHRHCRIISELQRSSAREAVGGWTKMAKQEGLNTCNSLFARACPREHVVACFHFARAEHTFEVNAGVGELLERGFDDTARRLSAKANNDHSECSCGAHGDGPRSDLGRAAGWQEPGALTYFRRRPVLIQQPEGGPGSAFDRQGLGEIVVWNVTIPDGRDDVGKQA